MRAHDYIADLAVAGRYCFTSRDAREALDVSADATKLALGRLARKKHVASPARGFHVILPPEYRSLGCLPAEQFVPELMRWLNQPYYAGLLSAAQFHGAAHHRPQEFQVMLTKPRRPIHCGHVRVAFIGRKRLHEVAVQSFKTPRGQGFRGEVSPCHAVGIFVGHARYLCGAAHFSLARFSLSLPG